MRNGSIMQLTVDQPWVQEAVERDILDLEDVRKHPNVHFIRRTLGSFLLHPSASQHLTPKLASCYFPIMAYTPHREIQSKR